MYQIRVRGRKYTNVGLSVGMYQFRVSVWDSTKLGLVRGTVPIYGLGLGVGRKYTNPPKGDVNVAVSKHHATPIFEDLYVDKGREMKNKSQKEGSRG